MAWDSHDTYSYCSLLGLLRGDCIYWEQIYTFTIRNKNENETNHLGDLQYEKLKRLWRCSAEAGNWLLWLPVLPSPIGEGWTMAQGHGTTTSMVPTKKPRTPVFPFLRFVHSFLSLTVMHKVARGTCNYNNWKKDTIMWLHEYLHLARDHINFMNLQRNVVPVNSQNSCLYCLFCLNSLSVRATM